MVPTAHISASPNSSPSMDCAVKLNNHAAFYIETGNYESAIASLQKALRLWEDYRATSVAIEIWCACYDCTLDGCIRYSEQRNSLHEHCHQEFASPNEDRAGNKRRRISAHKYIEVSEDDDYDAATHYKQNINHTRKVQRTSHTSDDHGFTYSNPIRIPQRHNMGSTCFFVIMFNLALANHLKILNTSQPQKDEIQGVVHLYELIFEYWSRLQADCSVERETDTATSSLRFVMILFNNMSRMYEIICNQTKQKQCLDNLLSIVMITVDCNARMEQLRSSNSDDNGNADGRETFQQSIDGFLTNVIPPEQCAQAA